MHIQPLGSHSVVGRYVNGVGVGVVLHSQTQICDDRCTVLLHQHIFRLEVSVSDGRLPWNREGDETDKEFGSFPD